jgi:DNA excision repair protein ERCC-2
MVVELSGIVPDGMVCFFTSYKYMEHIIVKWNEMGIL